MKFFKTIPQQFYTSSSVIFVCLISMIINTFFHTRPNIIKLSFRKTMTKMIRIFLPKASTRGSISSNKGIYNGLTFRTALARAFNYPVIVFIRSQKFYYSQTSKFFTYIFNMFHPYMVACLIFNINT